MGIDVVHLRGVDVRILHRIAHGAEAAIAVLWRSGLPPPPMQGVGGGRAVTMARLGPLAPRSIDSSPAIMLMMVPGMKNGEMRRGPFLSSSSFIDSISGSPPMPEPKLMPTRSA